MVDRRPCDCYVMIFGHIITVNARGWLIEETTVDHTFWLGHVKHVAHILRASVDTQIKIECVHEHAVNCPLMFDCPADYAGNCYYDKYEYERTGVWVSRQLFTLHLVLFSFLCFFVRKKRQKWFSYCLHISPCFDSSAGWLVVVTHSHTHTKWYRVDVAQ